jgi:GNAT superfamily N-acetyltransferase
VERKRMSDHQLAAIVQNDQVEIYVLYVGGVPAGYSELDFRRLPEVDLSYFGIMPEFIGLGLGPYLLRWTIAEAWRRGPNRLTVNTCTLDHPAALPLYQRLGFRAYDRRRTMVDPRV